MILPLLLQILLILLIIILVIPLVSLSKVLSMDVTVPSKIVIIEPLVVLK